MNPYYDLNDENFDLLASKLYKGNQWITEEYEADLKRVKYIKRLLGKYLNYSDLNERLILNHIITLNNVFGPNFLCKMLFFKHEEKFYPSIKSFLFYLNYLPDIISTINGQHLDTKIIPFDATIIERLDEI